MSASKTPDTALTELDREVTALAEVAISDPAAVVNSIVEKISAAETLDQVLAAASGGTGGGDLADVPFTIHSYSLARSRYSEGLGAFAVIDLTRQDSGERLVVTSGSTSVVAQLLRLSKLDLYPVSGVTFRVKVTGSGNDVQYLDKA